MAYVKPIIAQNVQNVISLYYVFKVGSDHIFPTVYYLTKIYIAVIIYACIKRESGNDLLNIHGLQVSIDFG